MNSTPVDLLLSGGWVVTADSRNTVIPNGSVAIKGDRIVAVGPTAEVAATHPAARVIDCSSKAILPGLIDCHAHTCQQLARGLADDIHVLPWLERIVAFEAVMDAEDVYWSARLACLEMIRSGTTAFIEGCANPFHVDAVGHAVADSGIRGVLTRSCMEVSEPDWKSPDPFIMTADENFTGTQRMIDRWHGEADGRIQAWVGWRQQWNLSDKLLLRLVEFAKERQVGLHGHLATRRYGQIEHLDRLGALWPDMVFAHAIHFRARELDLIKHYDVKIDHNPGASMHGGYGSAITGQFPEMLAKGITVCLGCDGAANNNTLDMFREVRLAATVHKEARKDPTAIPAGTALHMGTLNGAKALRMGEELGVLQAGRLADMIVVDMAQPHLQPVHDVISNLVYCATGTDVVSTIVGGRVLMEDRRVKVVNETEILAEAGRRAMLIAERWRSRHNYR